MGCIYHHPHIDLDEISDSYLNIPPNKLSKETEPAFLLDEFNMGLLKYVHNGFLNSLSFNMILPQIIQPTRIISKALLTILTRILFLPILY